VLLIQRTAARLRQRPRALRPPRRIAIFASMELLGGGVMISGISKVLKQVYPGAMVYVVGEHHRTGVLAPFLLSHGWIDDIIICPRRGESSFVEWWQFYRCLRHYCLDLCVLAPNHSCSNSVFLYLCGIPRIVGACLPVTTAHIGTKPYRLLHFMAAYARLLAGPSFTLETLVPFLRGGDHATTTGPERRRTVVLHPGGPPVKRWPPEHFVALGRLLVERDNAVVVIIGGPDERELGESIRRAIGYERQVSSRCGSTTSETIGYVAHADCYVGNNAGPMYLAVALGVPVVGVFRQSDRWFSGPDAASVMHCVVAADRLADVSPEEVLCAVRSRPVVMPALSNGQAP
jgi:ADP-heptose:LPS heptosyltransferase